MPNLCLLLLVTLHAPGVRSLPAGEARHKGDGNVASSAHGKESGRDGPGSAEWVQSGLQAARKRVQVVGAALSVNAGSVGQWAAKSVAGVLNKRGAGGEALGDTLGRVRGALSKLIVSEAVRRMKEDFTRESAKLAGTICSAAVDSVRKVHQAGGAAWRSTVQNVLLPAFDLTARAWDALLRVLRELSQGAASLARQAWEHYLSGQGSRRSENLNDRASMWVMHRWMEACKDSSVAKERLDKVSEALVKFLTMAGRNMLNDARTSGALWVRAFAGAGAVVGRSLTKMVEVHKRLLAWYREHPPMIYYIVRSVTRGIGSLWSPRRAQHAAQATEEPAPSAWWAGPSAAETGTTSWRELVNVMSSWSSLRPKSGDQAQAAQGKPSSGAKAVADSQWYITFDLKVRPGILMRPSRPHVESPAPRGQTRAPTRDPNCGEHSSHSQVIRVPPRDLPPRECLATSCFDTATATSCCSPKNQTGGFATRQTTGAASCTLLA